MTEPNTAARPGTTAQRAARDARRAAALAGVEVRELRALPELDAVCTLISDIWRPDPASPPLTMNWLRAFSKSGNYVAGAFAGSDLVGACVGFFAAPTENCLHSHIAGVSEAFHGRGVGFALKTHQRAWALGSGVATIAWTFDPLVRRNAYFDLTKLAATPTEYLTNFYGGMRDGINGNDESDRLLVHWHLASPAVAVACADRGSMTDAGTVTENSASVGLSVFDDGAPLIGDIDRRRVLLTVPADIEVLRAENPRLAHNWRSALRQTLTTLLGDGAVVTGFTRSGSYVLDRALAIHMTDGREGKL